MNPLFIYPDIELNVLLVRTLAILEKTSLNKKGIPVLSIDKIAVFDFLLKHPTILFSILKKSEKKLLFSLTDNEINSISSQFPSNDGLYRFEEHKKLVQVLIIWGFAEVTIGDSSDPLYQITPEGRTFFNSIDTEYSQRLSELAGSFSLLQSQTYKNLVAQIIPYINGK